MLGQGSIRYLAYLRASFSSGPGLRGRSGTHSISRIRFFKEFLDISEELCFRHRKLFSDASQRRSGSSGDRRDAQNVADRRRVRRPSRFDRDHSRSVAPRGWTLSQSSRLDERNAS